MTSVEMRDEAAAAVVVKMPGMQMEKWQIETKPCSNFCRKLKRTYQEKLPKFSQKSKHKNKNSFFSQTPTRQTSSDGHYVVRSECLPAAPEPQHEDLQVPHRFHCGLRGQKAGFGQRAQEWVRFGIDRYQEAHLIRFARKCMKFFHIRNFVNFLENIFMKFLLTSSNLIIFQ